MKTFLHFFIITVEEIWQCHQLISFFSNKIRAAGFSVSTVNQERDVDATHMLFLTLATVLQRLWGALPSLSTATVQVTVAV